LPEEILFLCDKTGNLISNSQLMLLTISIIWK